MQKNAKESKGPWVVNADATCWCWKSKSYYISLKLMKMLLLQVANAVYPLI